MKSEYFGPGSHDDDPEKIIKAMYELKLIPGTCIFLDICGINSEAGYVKTPSGMCVDPGPSIPWISVYRDVFKRIKMLDEFSKPLKIMGDRVMYYIPDVTLPKSEERLISLLKRLQQIVTTFSDEKDIPSLQLRGSIHHCYDVCSISFLQDSNGIPVPDYYGFDIDITEKLIKKARNGRLVISNSFYKLIEKNADIISDFHGPYIEEFIGYGEIEFWCWEWWYGLGKIEVVF